MMKPKKVEGKWRKPELSRRIVAKVRKAWLTDGREWPFEKPRTNYGGWAIEDLPKVKQKGKKVDRLAADRYVLFTSKTRSAPTNPLELELTHVVTTSYLVPLPLLPNAGKSI